MSNYAAKGTLLKKGDGASPEAFTTIAQVVNIGGPTLAQEPLDVTHHSSSSGWREFIGGLKDGGEISLEINFDPGNATHDETTGLQAELANGSSKNYRLEFPDTGATKITFAALVTAFEQSAPVDGKLSANVTLKVTGLPTWS